MCIQYPSDTKQCYTATVRILMLVLMEMIFLMDNDDGEPSVLMGN